MTNHDKIKCRSVSITMSSKTDLLGKKRDLDNTKQCLC